MNIQFVHIFLFLILTGVNSLQGSFWGKKKTKTIWDALEKNDTESFKYHLKNDSHCLVSRSSGGKTLLHMAVEKGLKEMVLLCAQEMITIDVVDNNHKTPLHYAVTEGNKEIAKILVEHGAKINAQDTDGNTIFHRIAKRPHRRYPDHIFTTIAADLDLRNKQGLTALHLAIMQEKDNCANMLLRAGALPIVKDDQGHSPLFYAAKGRSFTAIALLLDASKNLEVMSQDEHKWTPLHVACHGGWCTEEYSDTCRTYGFYKAEPEAVLAELIGRGADLNAQDNKGRTPLHCTILDNCEWACKYLLTEQVKSVHRGGKVNPEICDTDGFTPLHFAFLNRYWNLADLLVEHGASVKGVISSDGNTCLHELCQCQNNNFFTKVLNAKIDDINTKNNEGMTPLLCACEKQNEKNCRTLIENSASTTAVDSHMRTPLHVACQVGSLAMSKLILGTETEESKEADKNRILNAKAWVIPDDEIFMPESENSNNELQDNKLAGCEAAHLPVSPSQQDKSPSLITRIKGLFRTSSSNILKAKLSRNPHDLINHQDNTGCTPLHYASKQGNAVLCELLLTHGADPTLRNHENKIPLHLCFDADEREGVCSTLAKRSSAAINTLDNDDYSPLHIACIKGTLEECRVIINHGADVNCNKTVTPLLTCVVRACSDSEGYSLIKLERFERELAEEFARGHQTPEDVERNELYRLLLEAGADINDTDDDGCSVLHYIAMLGLFTDFLDTLTLYKPKINNTNNEGTTPLGVAAKYGRPLTCEAFMRRGADINVVNVGEKKGLLHVLGEIGLDNLPVPWNLIDQKKPDYNACDMHGRTPLHYAVFYGHKSLCEKLLSAGTEIAFFDYQLHTPLHRALVSNQTEIALLLLRRSAEVFRNLKNDLALYREPLADASDRRIHAVYFPLINLAATMGNDKICSELISRNFNVNESDDFGVTPLHASIIANAISVTKKFISAGAAINAQDKQGLTPLMYACKWERNELFDLLLTMPDLLKTLKDELIEGTALHWAVKRERHDYCQKLLNIGFHVDERDGKTMTSLHRACMQNNDKLISLLIKKGADVHATTKDGETPFHLAARWGKLKSLIFLLIHKHDCSLDINLPTALHKKTPLHLAVVYDQVGAVKLLLKYEAQPNIPDQHNKTPLMHAAEKGNLALCVLLKNKIGLAEFQGMKQWLMSVTRRNRQLYKLMSDYDYVPQEIYDRVPQEGTMKTAEIESLNDYEPLFIDQGAEEQSAASTCGSRMSNLGELVKE